MAQTQITPFDGITVTIRGRSYVVETLPAGSRSIDMGRTTYRLTGARGATYLTIRNRPHPDRLFLVREGEWGAGAMSGVWLTDADGPLREV